MTIGSIGSGSVAVDDNMRVFAILLAIFFIIFVFPLYTLSYLQFDNDWCWGLTNFDFTNALLDTITKLHPVSLNPFSFVLTTPWSPCLKEGDKICFFFELEHNLVYSSDRGNELYPGFVPVLGIPDQNYAVRVSSEFYRNSDIIIQYSLPNIYHLRTSLIFSEEILRKIVYIPAVQYLYTQEKEWRLANSQTIQRPAYQFRGYEYVTTIVNPTEGRRVEIIRRLAEEDIPVVNFNDTFDPDELELLLSKTKILLNIHQKDYYHTAEEFRLLPALLKGCIIVSEDVPLRELIPYHEYIIWVSDLNMLGTVLKTVSANYDHIFNSIHGPNSRLAEVLTAMKFKALSDLESRVLDVIKERQESHHLK